MPETVLQEALTRLCSGDEKAGEEVIALAYPELKRMARHALAGERSNHTLQPTALIAPRFDLELTVGYQRNKSARNLAVSGRGRKWPRFEA